VARVRSIERVVEGARAYVQSTLRIYPEAIPLAIAKKDSELAHGNLRRVSFSHLCAAMISARYEKNYAAAKDACSQCADYTDTLVAMAGEGLYGTPWSGFFVLHCALMAGRFDKAEATAQWMMQCPIVAEDSADPHDPLSLLCGYAVLDLREKFSACRRDRFDSSWHATHPFFGPLSIYLDLWNAVLTHSQDDFNAVIMKCQEHHVRLSKQRGEGRIGFGGGEDSLLIVDFMGISAAIVARRQGLSCDIDMEFLPKAMIEAALD
jgi:hypothetical protein